jgi:hypothetical protein
MLPVASGQLCATGLLNVVFYHSVASYAHAVHDPALFVCDMRCSTVL